MKKVTFSSLVVGDKFREHPQARTVFKKISNADNYNAEINGFSGVQESYKKDVDVWVDEVENEI